MRWTLVAPLLAAVSLLACDPKPSTSDDAGQSGGGDGGGTGGGSGGGGGGGVGGGVGGVGGGVGGGTGGGGATNSAPVFGALSPVTVNENASATVTLTATDPDGDALDFSIQSPPSFVTLTAATLTIAPTFADSGSYTLNLVVSDGTNLTSGTLSVTVIDVASNVTGTVVINAGDPAATNDPAVTLVVSSAAATTFCPKLSATAPAANDPCFTSLTTTAFNLGTGDGNKTVYAWFKDASGNISASPATDAILLDTVKPTLSIAASTLGLAAGKAFVNTTSVTFDHTANDAAPSSALAQVCVGDTNPPTECVAWTSAPSLTLPATEALHTRYVMVVDGAGNQSLVFSDTITYDVTAPVVTAVSINGGAATTGSTSVNVGTTVTEANALGAVELSNDGATFTSFAYSSPRAWTLTSGDGTKTVHARVTDAAGNVSSAPQATDDIVLDTLAPTATLDVQSGRRYANTATVPLTITPSETTAGMRMSIEVRLASAAAPTAPGTFVPFASPTNVDITGGGQGDKRIYVFLEDSGGNITPAPPTSYLIAYDSAGPTVTGFSLNNGAVGTKIAGVTLDYSASDTSGITAAQASNDGATFLGVSGPGDAWTLSISGGEGTKTVSLRLTDGAGNSTTVTDGIIYDVTPPVLDITSAGLGLNAGAPFTRFTSIPFNNSATDNLTGVTQVCAGSSSSFLPCISYGAYPLSIPSGDGLKTGYIKVVDGALNESAVQSDTITLDTTPPTISNVLIDDGGTMTSSMLVQVSVVAADLNGVATLGLANVGSAFTTRPFLGDGVNHSFTLSSADGTKVVAAQAIDVAGNASPPPYPSDDIELVLPPWGGYDAGPARLEFVCTSTQWCYSYPHPHSMLVNSLVQDGKSGVWAVSPAYIGFLQGTFMRSEGIDWGWAPGPSNGAVQEATSVDQAGLSGQLWGYGNSGLYRWNGAAWAFASSMPTYATDMVGFDDGNAFIVGNNGMIGQLGAAADGGFLFQLTDAGLLNAVWGPSPQDVWVGGRAVRHYDGLSWSDVPLPVTTNTVHAIEGSASNDVWLGGAAGSQGFLWHWDGMNVSAVATTVGIVRSIAVESPGRAWAVTSSGGVYLWDGLNWTLVKTVNAGLNTVLRRWNGEIWVGGNGGLVMSTVDGGSWLGDRRAPAGEGRVLFNVSADERYAVGDEGSVLRWAADAGWDLVTSLEYADGGPARLTGGWAAASNDVWVAGGPSVFRYDGASWVEQPMPSGMSAGKISGSSSSDVWVTSSNRQLAHWNGSAWTAYGASSFNSANDVQVFSPSMALASTSNTGFYRWDGGSWSQAPGGAIANALWGPSSNAVWGPGDYGSIYFFNGATVSQVRPTNFSQQRLTCVGGTSTTDVWVGGYNTLLHWNGSSWVSMASLQYFDHSSILATTPTDVMVSTWRDGDVLRYRP